jgi:hypothetical protein
MEADCGGLCPPSDRSRSAATPRAHLGLRRGLNAVNPYGISYNHTMQLPRSFHIAAPKHGGWTPASRTHLWKLTRSASSVDASNKFCDNRATKSRSLFPSLLVIYKETCQRVGNGRPDMSAEGDCVRGVSGRYTDCQLTDESTQCTHSNPRQSIRYRELGKISFTSLLPDREDI